MGNEVLITIISSSATVLVALIGIITVAIQARNSKKELEKKFNLEFQQYKNQDLYEIQKKVVFKALSLIDDYVSWLKIDGKKPIRKLDCSTSEFTFQAREIYNELCLTVKNEKLVNLFSELLFSKGGIPLGKISDFRKEARKELDLPEIAFPKETAFISQVSTDDLATREQQQSK